MEPTISLLLLVIFSVVALAILGFILVRLVIFAKKKGGKGVQAFGAAMMLFGFGSPKDPVNDIIEQAEKLKRGDEDNAGDPPVT
jgi:hypothetical protein